MLPGEESAAGAGLHNICSQAHLTWGSPVSTASVAPISREE